MAHSALQNQNTNLKKLTDENMSGSGLRWNTRLGKTQLNILKSKKKKKQLFVILAFSWYSLI